MNLSKTDHKILRALLEDGRAKVSTIASKTRLSREIVDYQIKKLVRKGVITKFTVLIDETKLGYYLAQVLFKVRIESKAQEGKILHYLTDFPYTTWVVQCGGGYTFAIELYAQSVSHLDLLLQEIGSCMGKLLVSFDTFIVVHQYKYTFGIGDLIHGLINVGERFEASGPQERRILAPREMKLLSALEEDGRKTLVDLSRILHLNPDTTKYHLQKLKREKILLKIVPEINLLHLGYQKHIVIVHLKNLDMSKNPLKEYVQSNDAIRYCVRHLGKLQLYMLMFSTTTQEFHHQIQEISLQFNDIVDWIEFYPVFQKYKESLFPKGLSTP